MMQAAPSTTATRPTIPVQTQQATNVSQATIWEVLEESRRTQLIKCFAELIRRLRDSPTIDEGGLDEPR
jgi:hypothetical protein